MVCLLEMVVAFLFYVTGFLFRGKRIAAAAVRGGKRTWKPISPEHHRTLRRHGRFRRRLALLMILLGGGLAVNFAKVESELRHLKSQRGEAPDGGNSAQDTSAHVFSFTDFSCANLFSTIGSLKDLGRDTVGFPFGISVDV